MNRKASSQRNSRITCPNVKHSRGNASYNHIIGGAQTCKKRLTVPFLRQKKSRKLYHEYLKNCHKCITPVTVRKRVQFHAVRYAQCNKGKHTDKRRLLPGIAARNKQVQKQHQENMAYHIVHIFIIHCLRLLPVIFRNKKKIFLLNICRPVFANRNTFSAFHQYSFLC